MSDSTTAPSLPELYRLLCNLLRVGLVEQVDHGNALVRVRVGALNHLASVLAADGIPAYADASESYFDALEE